MEDKEAQQTPEIKDTPEHMFVKDQLAGINFLNPETQEKTSLRDRLGKLFQRYEVIVLAQFDLLRATEGPPTRYKEDAKKRAEVIYRDWKSEQRAEASGKSFGGRQDYFEQGTGQGSRRIIEDDYSEESYP